MEALWIVFAFAVLCCVGLAAPFVWLALILVRLLAAACRALASAMDTEREESSWSR